jgi:hypothetical protein
LTSIRFAQQFSKVTNYLKNKIAVLILTISIPIVSHSQNKFYNYYTSGLEYMDKKDWVQAISELKSAASLEFEDAKHKRTYGTHFIEYFLHREMGIAYYNLNEVDNAKSELGLSYSYVQSDRAAEFLNKIEPNLADKILKSFEVRKNAISGNLASDEKKQKEEEDRVAAERIKSAQEELERIRTANRQKALAEHQKKAEDERTAAAQRRQKEAADSLAVSQKALAEQKQREEAEKVAAAQRRQKKAADSLAVSQKALAEQKQREEAEKVAAAQRRQNKAVDSLAASQKALAEQKQREEAENCSRKNEHSIECGEQSPAPCRCTNV